MSVENKERDHYKTSTQEFGKKNFKKFLGKDILT